MRENEAMNAQRKRNREAADWLLRNGDPRQSAEDRARFTDWLKDPENCRTYSAAERLMGDARKAIQSDPKLAAVRATPRNLAKPVATIVVLFSMATATFFLLDGPMRFQADVIAGTDEMPVIELEDGSRVQLNASSAIAIDFNPNRRAVRLLRGQAYFEIAHAPERPFSVDAGTTRVTALGTAFDVRYGETDTEVTVTENAVLVEPDNNRSSSQRVRQGEQATYDRIKGETNIKPVDSLVALAWKRGQIAVDSAPLSYVVEEMNRHFSGRIVVAGKSLAARRVSGTIAIADTDAALAFVIQALGVKMTRLGPLIVIRD